MLPLFSTAFAFLALCALLCARAEKKFYRDRTLARATGLFTALTLVAFGFWVYELI